MPGSLREPSALLMGRRATCKCKPQGIFSKFSSTLASERLCAPLGGQTINDGERENIGWRTDYFQLFMKD